MREPDLVRMRHMLDAAREIGTLTEGMSVDDHLGKGAGPQLTPPKYIKGPPA
jgi:hypothetical protein